MAAIENENIYGLQIRESANDGSDFTTPAADYRKLWLGESAGLYVKDSAAAIVQVGHGSGTSFPASPNTNDRFFHTTHAIDFFYDGTRWRSTGQNQLSVPLIDQDLPHTATSQGGRSATPVWSGSDIWLIQTKAAFFVAGGGSALSASHKWVGVLAKQPAGTTIATFTIDSGASGAWREVTVSIGALLTTTNFELDVFWTKTGTPGNLYASVVVSFQYVAV